MSFSLDMWKEQAGAQLPMRLGMAPYNNQFLFSDHYLDHILTGDPRWDAGLAETEAFLEWLRDLYACERDQLDAYSEAQLEEHWFKPILDRLGHVYETQARVPGLGHGVRKPDYVFFTTEAARQEVVSAQKTADYAIHALAVGEVKAWDVHLSKKQRGGGSSFDRQNPSYQIDYYLKATQLTWGILSNGRRWRLVHRATSYRLDTYYEVDLIDLLEQDAPDESLAGETARALRYFYLFFRQAALRPDEQGRIFLADVLAGSRAYAVALEEDLQENAYHALEHLMQGFLDVSLNRLGADDLRAIYQNSLYLLYRLLFILYGESRGLLPVGNRRYRELYGFGHIKGEIADQIDRGTYIARRSSMYYDRLKSLFHLINGDDPEFNAEVRVVRYNGGLFDPAQHPFLIEKSVGDRAFVLAVDLLCRRAAQDGGQEFVDYRTLDVRHLGSIYEGLLEYQPRLATEPMVAIRDRNGEQWLPADKAPRGARVIAERAPGQIYLETDKGERKATGSYYTPQYIVEYIVEQTVEPLVERALDVVKAEKYSDADAGAALAEKILALKVLDPAMGSGHFLVEATDYLARALATDPYVETTEALEESDLNHWRRRVVERCIYGVDKNPLAVELAKLSLWLHTFAGDKPLGFLDHHLVCGDSLIGAEIADLEEQPEVLLSKKAQRRRKKEAAAGVTQLELGLFAGAFNQRLPEMLRELFAILEQESANYEAVREKEAAHVRVQALKAPFITVANLYTSAHFGNDYTEAAYKEALRAIGDPDQLLGLEAVQVAQAIAAERRFLHWELAFPEAFFDRAGRPLGDAAGFDAVVGNPPYVSAWSMIDNDIDFRSVIISLTPVEQVLSGHWDLYVPFLLEAFHLCKASGMFSFIIPDAFCREKYAAEPRRFLLENTWMVRFAYSGEENVFEGVSRHTIIPVFKKSIPDFDVAEVRIDFIDVAKKKFSIKPSVQSVLQFTFCQLPEYQIRYGKELDGLTVVGKVDDLSVRLGDICYVNYGAQVSSKEKGKFGKDHVVSREPLGNAKRFFDGKNLSRYAITWDSRYLDYRPQEMYGPRAPELFESPKVVVRDVTGVNEQLIVSYDDSGLYCDHLVVCVTYYESIQNTDLQSRFQDYTPVPYPYPNLLYITGLLASKLVTWYFRTILATGTLQGSYSHTYPQQIRAFPIRRIDFTTPEAQRAALLTQAIALYDARDHAALLAFTADRLAAEPEQADVIHDLLAHLAEQMITLNKQKQQRVSDFYLDLEGITDADTFARLQKGKQGRTLWKTEACRPFVEQGSYTTHSLEESLGWNEDCYKAFVKQLAGSVPNLSHLVRVYKAHAPAYRAAVQHIAATEQLIDQIVYQLYGLTEQEIAIVEGEK